MAPSLSPNMMSVWRLNAGSLLPTGAAIVSMGDQVTKTSLSYDETNSLQDAPCFNSELYELLSDIDVVQRINIQRFGHVVRMEPCIQWKEQIEETRSSICVTNWCKRARSRGAWNDVMRQPEIR